MASKMNLIRKEILASMKNFKADQNTAEASFLFTPDFSGFKGHFPDNPVFPGICQVQAGLLILESWKKQELKMDELVLAKFYSPVSLNEEIIFKAAIEDSSAGLTARFKVTAKDKKVSDLKLIFSNR
jgi:3-hydroxyacyl-[acyl-carrier-protein] dehydratase